MKLRPRIRVFQKVRLAPSRWQFVALPREGNSWIRDPPSWMHKGESLHSLTAGG